MIGFLHLARAWPAIFRKTCRSFPLGWTEPLGCECQSPRYSQNASLGLIKFGDLSILEFVVGLERYPAVFRQWTRANHLGNDGLVRMVPATKDDSSRFAGKPTISFSNNGSEN